MAHHHLGGTGPNLRWISLMSPENLRDTRRKDLEQLAHWKLRPMIGPRRRQPLLRAPEGANNMLKHCVEIGNPRLRQTCMKRRATGARPHAALGISFSLREQHLVERVAKIILLTRFRRNDMQLDAGLFGSQRELRKIPSNPAGRGHIGFSMDAAFEGDPPGKAAGKTPAGKVASDVGRVTGPGETFCLRCRTASALATRRSCAALARTVGWRFRLNRLVALAEPKHPGPSLAPRPVTDP